MRKETANQDYRPSGRWTVEGRTGAHIWHEPFNTFTFEHMHVPPSERSEISKEEKERESLTEAFQAGPKFSYNFSTTPLPFLFNGLSPSPPEGGQLRTAGVAWDLASPPTSSVLVTKLPRALTLGLPQPQQGNTPRASGTRLGRVAQHPNGE